MLASALVYVLTSNQLRGQVDTQLRTRGAQVTRMVQLLREGRPDRSRTAGERRSLERALGANPNANAGSPPRLGSLLNPSRCAPTRCAATSS